MQVLEEGQTIQHEQYGRGVVASSDAERTTIDFDDFGMKKFVTSLWSAEILADAPERPAKAKRRSRKPKAAK